jgi:hypothetical protein
MRYLPSATGLDSETWQPTTAKVLSRLFEGFDALAGYGGDGVEL